jgi:hypothetical protein
MTSTPTVPTASIWPASSPAGPWSTGPDSPGGTGGCGGPTTAGRTALAALTSAALAAALFGLGWWASTGMRNLAFLGPQHVGGTHGQVVRLRVPNAIAGRGTPASGAASLTM